MQCLSEMLGLIDDSEWKFIQTEGKRFGPTENLSQNEQENMGTKPGRKTLNSKSGNRMREAEGQEEAEDEEEEEGKLR